MSERLDSAVLRRLSMGAEPFECGKCARCLVAASAQVLAERLVAWLLPEWRQQPEPDIAGLDFRSEDVPLLIDAHPVPPSPESPLRLARYWVRARNLVSAAHTGRFRRFALPSWCVSCRRRTGVVEDG